LQVNCQLTFDFCLLVLIFPLSQQKFKELALILLIPELFPGLTELCYLLIHYIIDSIIDIIISLAIAKVSNFFL